MEQAAAVHILLTLVFQVRLLAIVNCSLESSLVVDALDVSCILIVQNLIRHQFLITNVYL